MTNDTPTSIPAFASRMKEDWNSRAHENAKWFINTVGVAQSDEEFFAGGRAEVEDSWLPDFREALRGRDLRHLRILEIGCGIGRMTCPLAEAFGEVWAVDVSGEMIRQARQRFSHLTNINWLEVEGVNLDELPNDYFDLGFSVYVYQHMPNRGVISRNIAGAFSKVKPGGLYKFHTNGLERKEFEEIEKDTWIGASFAEGDIRRLALEIDAQLVGIKGRGTQYCWTTFRKRPPESAGGGEGDTRQSLVVEIAGRADDLCQPEVPAFGNDARLGLVLSGLDVEIADCNSVVVRLREQDVLPVYVGRIIDLHLPFVQSRVAGDPAILGYVEIEIPEGIGEGSVEVEVEHASESTGTWSLMLENGETQSPKIVTIRNGSDHGTDIYSSGPKSFLNLFVHGLDESATVENVELRLAEVSIKPDFVGFVRRNGTWQVNAQLSEDQKPGVFDLKLIFRGCESDLAPIVIKDTTV